MYGAFAQKNLETLMKSRNEFTTNEEYNEYLRIYFAGLAMQGLLANPQYWKRVYKTLSSLKANKDSIECVFTQFSIKLADEILKQLEEK
mgnify:CR=1 FL=1